MYLWPRLSGMFKSYNICAIVTVEQGPALAENLCEIVLKVLEQDFANDHPQVAAFSRNDRYVLDIMQNTCGEVDAHYQMVLPRKGDEMKTLDNKMMANPQPSTSTEKLEADSELYEKYYN